MELRTNAAEPSYVSRRIVKIVLPIPRYGRLVFKLIRVFHFYALEIGYVHYAHCTGVLSRFRNTHLQAIFADFDTGPLSQAEVDQRVNLEDIAADIANSASQVGGLGSFFIFESSPGHYHAVDFSLHDVMTARRFLAGLRFGDEKYLGWLMKHGENTVRISEKRNERKTRPIRFVKFLGSENPSLVHHGGLMRLYESLHPEIRPYTRDLRHDESTLDDLYVFEYKTMTW